MELDAGFTLPVFDARQTLVEPDLNYELPRPDGSALTGEQLCDGKDEDNNGIVDDVDFAGDGICDCLPIAMLGRALHEKDATFEAWLGRRSGGVTQLRDQLLTDELLAPFKVLIVQNVTDRPYGEAEVAVLERWVSNGGGLMTLTAYTADFTGNINDLLAPFGLHYGPTLVLVNPFANVSLPVDTWYPHPVTAGITSAGVVSAYEVQGGGSVLAEGNDLLAGKVVMLRAVEHGKGKVLAWGDEWITYDSEWVARTDYQVARLWQNALQWFGGERECKVRIII